MAVFLAPVLHAQGLADRVANAAPGAVQFNFPARAGVCGNGRSFIQSTNGFYGDYYSGTYITNGNGDVVRTEACQNGPVRVIVDRAGREIISIKTYVGTPAQPAPTSQATATDLGHVSGQTAADFLLDLAAKAEGRVGRDAIFPATLADSASSTDRLIAIAKNQALNRDTRRAALSYMNNSVPAGQVLPARASDAIVAIARDETDNQQVRQSALSVLARLEHGAGILALEQLSKEQGYTWLAKESIAALSNSGDPRAREFLRTTLQRDDLSDEVMAQVIRSLGQQYSTAADAALLRSIYPKLHGEKSRNAVINAVGEVGGTENVRFLMDVARSDSSMSSGRRSQALEAANRAGVTTAELIKLYDGTTDQRLKESVVNILVRVGDQASTDKLISIIKTETNYNIRRNTISRLSNSDDPRIKAALKDIISR
jgi:HEAT repeat protein